MLRRGRRDVRARLLVSNHRNMTDAVLHGVLHHPAFLAREDVFASFAFGPVLAFTRSLPVSKVATNAGVRRELAALAREHPVVCCAEGTTSAEHCVIRLRPGALECGLRVQPVVIRYRTARPASWLTESGPRHLAEMAANFGIAVVRYLDVVERETPDQLGKRIADALGVPYLPYSNRDYEYFSGHCSDAGRCTKEYLRDFGWMGTIDDYKRMCSSAGLNPRYQWSR